MGPNSADQCITELDDEILKMPTNVKRSETMSDMIVPAMSRACGAGIFLFELFKKPRKHLLSLQLLRNERGLLASMAFNNMMHAMHEY